MIIHIDDISVWKHISTLTMDRGETRRYYLAAAPYRALLVCRHGLSLGALRGSTVDAQVGTDRADPGFARVPGEPQTKITIYRAQIGAQPVRLSRVLRDAPRD